MPAPSRLMQARVDGFPIAHRLAPGRVSLLDAPFSPVQQRWPWSSDRMTAHPLTPLLAPSSVAIFGASNDPTRIGGRSLRYYREAGYQGGSIQSTRPRHGAGLTAYPDLASVPGGVECAVIAVPANLAIRSMGLRREGRQGRRHVHRRLCRDRPRRPRDAGAHHSGRARQRHPVVRAQLPRPVQHADRPPRPSARFSRKARPRPARSAW